MKLKARRSFVDVKLVVAVVVAVGGGLKGFVTLQTSMDGTDYFVVMIRHPDLVQFEHLSPSLVGIDPGTNSGILRVVQRLMGYWDHLGGSGARIFSPRQI